MGRAASGKDTLAGKVITGNRTMVLSHTTRPKRENEGETHRFIDSIEPYPNRWLETTIRGHSYFILEEDLYEHDILLIDTKGFLSLIQEEEFKRPYRVFYIDVPMPIRRERYLKRDNVTEQDFIQRNSDEDLQFTNFEELLSDPEYLNNHNIHILRTEEDLDEATYIIHHNINIGRGYGDEIQPVGEA